MAKTPPNILVIMSDQQSKHVLGCYGNTLVRTPNIDRLAAGGMRFTGAYCPAPLCVPSRMSFMTGRTPSRNRVWTNNNILCSSIPTWAHVLGAAGYETALMGRMHFVGTDHRHGFTRRPYGEWTARHPGVPEQGGPRYTRFPGSTAGGNRVVVEHVGRGPSFYQWYDRQVGDAACAYLCEASHQTRPFAAVVGFHVTHSPFIAPKPLFDYYYPRVDIPAPVETESPFMRAFRASRGFLDPPIPEQRIRLARAAYYGMCEYGDAQIGRVLDTLDACGLADNTVVIYCSDHGEMAGEHGCWTKSCFHEASAGIPLVVRYPGRTAPGATCNLPCSLMDLGPTFAELAGADAGDVDGRSLVPELTGAVGECAGQTAFSEMIYGPLGAGRMIRRDQWKLWHARPAGGDALPPVLFNLDDDPEEMRDLGQDNRHSEIREELMAELGVGWEPADIHRDLAQQQRDMNVLSAWGRQTRPDCHDTVAFPGPEIEADLELL
jgi:choline-sulfatase